jgi:2-hydroxy-6-oxonona-2,4-dienedioate hydrolase
MSDTLTTLEQGARVLHTPCGGDGPLVWHVWGEGPPLLLLHGGSGSWTHWVRNVAPLAASGRSVWVPDMPGFGDSALPPGCEDADQLPPWLEQGLQLLLGETPVDVLAFSFGALVAGYLATAHPDRVASLLLIGAPALSAEALPPLPLLLWQRHPPGPARDAAHRRNLRLLMLAHDDAVDELALAVHAAS